MAGQRPSGAVTFGSNLVTFMLLVAVVFGAYRIVSTAVVLADGANRSIDVQAFVPREAVKAPRGTTVVDQPEVRIHIAHPTKAQTALAAAMDLGPIVLFIAGLWLLRGVARSVREGDPFVADNVRRLRGIGFLLVAGSIGVEILNSSLRLALENRMPPNPSANLATRGFSIPGTALLAGLGVFILAEVFAHGLRLREDVEGTV
jgi:hypothetical protein